MYEYANLPSEIVPPSPIRKKMHLSLLLLVQAASGLLVAPRAFALPENCRRSLPRCAEVENAAPLVEPPVAMKDIIDTAVSAGSFTTLATALGAARLVDTLKGEGPFTVFAPTDAAFAKLPAGTVEDLLKPDNKAKLASILTYHVVSAKVMAKTVVTMDGQKVATVNGAKITIKVGADGVMIDGAKVVTTDIECANGVIHIIDSVILPAAKPSAMEMAMEMETAMENAMEMMADGAGAAPGLEGALERERLKVELLSRAAACARGESATATDLKEARELVAALEMLNPTPEPTLAPECMGTWELVFSDTQLFRSSPFFMAGRAVCADGAEAERYDWFCDMHRAALAISTIGKVRQVYDGARIVSEFEVSAGAVPFLGDVVPFLRYSGGMPLSIRGAIVSTASVEANLGDAWRLLMDTVEIKGSNLPGLRQALDAGVRLESRSLGAALESVVPTYANPRPLFKTTYLDARLRISRDQDGKLFVYTKLSDATSPTRYDEVPADLGASALLQGVASKLLGL